MATENLSIASDANDGEDDGTTWNDWSPVPYSLNTYFRLGERAGTNWRGGLRFQIPNIGQGETITSATLTVRCTGTSQAGTGNLTVRVHGNDTDSAAAFGATYRPQGTGWTDTTASADQTFAVNVAADITWDVTSIVQELVDRAGWVADNFMAFALRDVSASYVAARMVDYDATTLADVATLDIVYPDAGGSNQNFMTLLGVG